MTVIGYATLAQYIEARGGFVVSAATLRAQDLVLAFLRVLVQLDPERAQFYRREFAPTLGMLEAAGAADADDVAWLLDGLADDINAALPAGYHFDGHPDDPACFLIAHTDVWDD